MTAQPPDLETDKVPLWRRHTTIAAAVTAIMVVIATACGSDPAATEPATPGGSDPGADLYQSNCASCHGSDLRGTDKGPSHLSLVYEPNHHGDDAFRSAILNGARQHHWNFGDMAAITGLDDNEINEIIAYVRSEQERQGFEQ
jgi:mono/diheme cytochrome c family protein